MGCYQGHLYVQQERVTPADLASSHIGSPDPRAGHPPIGQRLVLAWDFPRSEFRRDLTFHITVRLWNNEEKHYTVPIVRKRGITDFFFSNPTDAQELKILTYRVLVQDASGQIVDKWVHQFWTELIQLESR